MKKFLLTLTLLLGFFVSARAQTSFYNNSVQVLGTSNSVCLATNTLYLTLKQFNLILTGSTNAATSVAGDFPLLSFDKSVFYAATSTTNAIGLSDLTTNVPATTVAIPIYLYGRLRTGTNAINVSAIYGP